MHATEPWRGVRPRAAARARWKPPARALAALAALVPALVLGSLLGGAWHSLLGGGGRVAASEHAGLGSLPASAQAEISDSVGASDPAYRVRAAAGAPGALVALSAPARLSARFYEGGVTVRAGATRVQLASPALGPSGVGATDRPLAHSLPTAQANRATFAGPGISETYVNGPLGLEQRFTVSRPPAAGASLVLSMAVSGNATPTLASDHRSLLLARAGAATLRYGGLSASDATGRSLPSRLGLEAGRVTLSVDTRGARYPLTIDPLLGQGEQLTGAGEQGGARFGLAVAMSADGSTALVGAPRNAQVPGAVFVFVRSGPGWVQQGEPLTSGQTGGEGAEACGQGVGAEGSEECGFGASVALSGDGNTALVGAPRQDEGDGAAWIFTRSGSTWTRQQELTGGEEEVGRGHFGASVSLSTDGTTALVGAPGDRVYRGAAWVFANTGAGFAAQGEKLTGTAYGEIGEGHFGHAVALTGNGDVALIGATDDDGGIGAAWAFERSGSSWGATQELTGAGESGSGRFGQSVALSEDGSTAAVGGRSDGATIGAAWVFARSGGSYAQQGEKLTPTGGAGSGQLFGYSVALSGDGGTLLIGGPRDAGYAGAAWLFTSSGSTWTQQGGKITDAQEAGDPGWLGSSVALSGSGESALIGAPREALNIGSVLAFPNVFERAPTVTAVTPRSGPSSGGTPVTITGSGFLAGSTVEIGTPATSVTVVSETEITAETSATPAGKYEVVVADGNGSSTGGPSFTYKEASSGSDVAGSTGSSVSAGSQARSAVLGTGVVPPPVLGVSGNLDPLSGKVLVKLPGSRTFVPLTGLRQVPFGTIVNAINGRVSLTTATPGGGTQSITFYSGEFRITQSRNGQVVASLYGGNFSRCPTARQRSHTAAVDSSRHYSPKHVVRRLWAEGHGKYATKGNYASGAVLGTKWLTEDLCYGTLIHVYTDRVLVTNLLTHHHYKIAAGHGYLARVH